MNAANTSDTTNLSPMIEVDLSQAFGGDVAKPKRRLVNWYSINYVDIYEETSGSREKPTKIEIHFQNGQLENLNGYQACESFLTRVQEMFQHAPTQTASATSGQSTSGGGPGTLKR